VSGDRVRAAKDRSLVKNGTSHSAVAATTKLDKNFQISKYVYYAR